MTTRHTTPVMLPDLIAQWARRTPDALAVSCVDERLTYRELDERANQLGRHLRGLGAGPDTIVALHLSRSATLIVGLLGVLKAGAAYLPLDVGLPAERLAVILAGARPGLVLTESALAGALPAHGARTVCVDGDRMRIETQPRQACESGLLPGHLAYVIYTSGSTGVPKGVMIDHRALRERVLAKAGSYRIRPDDRFLQFTAVSFDASADEIYPTLVSGAALVVHPEPSRTSPPELLAECERRGVTAMMLPPVYLQLLLDAMTATGLRMPWLRLFVTGGESITVRQLAAFARLVPHRPRFFYAYGPTETTIAATMWQAPMAAAEIERLDRVPIGRALPDTGTHVLDDALRPVPPGEVGELWLSGSGLARGYLGDPALTAQRFRPCPFAAEPGARMYRTGDLVRQAPGGDLAFVGRLDDQVKIRGHRVDLGDVTAALADHPDLGPVAVLGDNGRLVAYVVPRPGARLGARELREFSAAKLPDYMVPSAFVSLDALPLAPGGKIDRRALPEPAESAESAESADDDGGPAGSPIEELLSGIWCELLGLDRVGVRDDFFDLGGDSLLANQVIAKVRDALGVQVPLRSMFESPTISGLAEAVTTQSLSVGDEELLDLLSDLERLQDGDR